MGRHHRNGNHGGVIPVQQLPGGGFGHVQEHHILPSPHDVAKSRVYLFHHREFPNAQPVPIRFETNEGPFLKVMGGLTKLEHIAGTIAANPLIKPEDAVAKAKQVLALCEAEADRVDQEREEEAERMIQQMQQNGQHVNGQPQSPIITG